MSAPQQPPPGWYDDPSGTDRQRWWDGTAWGEQYRARQGGWAPPAPPAGPSFTGGNAGSNRTWVVAAHGSAFLGAWVAVAFVGPLVVYFARRDDELVRRHAAAALNFQLSWLLYGIVLAILAVVVLFAGGFPDPVLLTFAGILVGGAWILITGFATLRATRSDEVPSYPLAIPFVR